MRSLALRDGSAHAINDAGAVVGTSRGFAFFWQESIGAAPLEADRDVFPTGSAGLDINDSGRFVGGGGTDATPEQPFFVDYQNASQFGLGGTPPPIDFLDPLSGPGGLGFAAGLNEAGQVVGRSTSANGFEATLWDGAIAIGLGDLEGGGFFGTAFAINGLAQVVGDGLTENGVEAFLWEAAADMRGLGDLAGGDLFSRALGINDRGDIVGFGTSAVGRRAVLWDDAFGLRDLNDLIDRALGWSLLEARAINASGQIVGLRTNPDGFTEAFLLSAVPEPAPGLLLAMGLLGLGMARRSPRSAPRLRGEA